MQQDRFGFLWVGTEDGLNRFDGYEFRIYQQDPSDTTSISNNVVYTIAEDGAGRLWVGTASGLNLYDRYADVFRTYRYSSEGGSISDNTITAIIPIDSTALWVGTRNGLNYLDLSSGQFHVFRANKDGAGLSNNRINDLLLDKAGRLWCATAAGLDVFDPRDSSFVAIEYGFNRSDALPNPNILSLSLDHWGRVWVGTARGLAYVTPELEISRVLEPNVPLSEGLDAPVYALHCAEPHLVWVGSDQKLLCLDEDGEPVQTFDRQTAVNHDLSEGPIWSLFGDRGGALWIGTPSDGLYRFAAQQQIFEHLPNYRNAAEDRLTIRTVLPVDKFQWLLGTDLGLMLLDVESGTYTAPDYDPITESQLAGLAVRDAIRYNGSYLIATADAGLVVLDSTLSRIDSYTVDTVAMSGLSSNRITCLLGDTSGVWVGTIGGGLNLIESSGTVRQWRFTGDRKSGLLDNHVTALAADSSGYIWVGTANRGVSRFDPHLETFVHFEQGDTMGKGINVNAINDLCIDRQNRIWVATIGGGLTVMNTDGAVLKTFRTPDGMPANTVNGIAVDAEGIVWAGTHSGIARVDLVHEEVRKFNRKDGLRQLGFMPRAAGVISNNCLWLGAVSGMVAFDPSSYLPATYTAPIVFTELGVTTSEQGVQLEERFFPRSESPIELNHNLQTVTIAFAMLNLMQSEKNTYAYLVSPIMKDWVDLGELRKVTLSNLKPGKYEVFVNGANRDGIWHETSATLTIVVRPAFYQTAWFKLLLILLLCTGIFGLYRWGTARMKARNRMLEAVIRDRTKEIAQERDEKAVLLKEIHHRVKNNLQIISSLLSLQSRLADDPNIENLLLESTNRVQSMSMIHEKMYRSENLREVNLDQYLRELLQSLVEAYNVDRNIRTEIEVQEASFTVDTLTPLGLIINELVSNALKYAFKGRKEGCIYLRLERGEDDTYHLFVGDDGVGFDEQSVRKGSFGTELVEDLAEQLQGHIERSAQSSGTSYHLVFKSVDHH